MNVNAWTKTYEIECEHATRNEFKDVYGIKF